MTRSRLVLLVLGGAAALAALVALQEPAAIQQITMPATPEGKCLYLADATLDRNDEQALRQQLATWVDACRNASEANPADARLKLALSKALWHAEGRPASLGPLREAIAQGSTEAMLALFNDFNSFDRHLGRPDLIPRAEAEQALRKAAELGDAEAIWRLATIKSRGGPFKHDMAEARRWGEKAIANPPKDSSKADIQLMVGHWFGQSDDAAERKRGIAMLEALGSRGDAQAYLGEAIRKDDPVRARALLEGAVRREPGHALAPLAEMLLAGEGGPKDEKRALSLLQGAPYDAQHARAVLGWLMLEGRLVPRDPTKAIDLIRPWAQWDYDTRLKVVHAVANNPQVKLQHPDHFLYVTIEAAEQGEPGMMDALIALKLSQHVRFGDKAGGCALAERAAKAGDTAAAKHLAACK